MERCSLGWVIERECSIFSSRQGSIHRSEMDRSRVYLFQIETGNTLEGIRVVESAQKMPHDLVVEQAAKEHTISCQLLHKWRLSYV